MVRTVQMFSYLRMWEVELDIVILENLLEMS